MKLKTFLKHASIDIGIVILIVVGYFGFKFYQQIEQDHKMLQQDNTVLEQVVTFLNQQIAASQKTK
jgi:predicted negative regulator of RcsB-dependent stress response